MHVRTTAIQRLMYVQEHLVHVRWQTRHAEIPIVHMYVRVELQLRRVCNVPRALQAFRPGADSRSMADGEWRDRV